MGLVVLGPQGFTGLVPRTTETGGSGDGMAGLWLLAGVNCSEASKGSWELGYHGS